MSIDKSPKGVADAIASVKALGPSGVNKEVRDLVAAAAQQAGSVGNQARQALGGK